MVEAAGIEPASKDEDFKETTCLVSDLISDRKPPTDELFLVPAYKVSPACIGIQDGYPTEFDTISGLKREEDPYDVAATKRLVRTRKSLQLCLVPLGYG
jgi:hypothetical protein